MHKEDENRLAALLSEVQHARARVREGGRSARNAVSPEDQRQRATRLAEALEAYAEAAVTCGVPLSARCRAEMHLYRSMH
jgi:hypothetical protein